MKKVYGCVHIYFWGVVLFFTTGGLFIYYDHPIIRVIIGIPGVLLLMLTIVTMAAISDLKKADRIVIHIKAKRIKNKPGGKR